MMSAWLIIAILCFNLQDHVADNLQKRSLNRDELSEDYLRQIKLIEVRNNNEDLQPFNLKENLIAELDNFYFQIDSFIANFNDTSENQKKLTFLDIIKIFIEANSNSEIVIPAFCPLKKDQQGIYKINVTGLEPFDVLCNADIAGPGWTTIAQRQKGTVNFLKSWASYKEGFGNFTDDFFIGMEKLHAITTSQNQELYIYLEDFEGNFRHARYDDLMIGSESENYALVKLGLYSGNAGDSLSEHVGLNFSTFDRDNDNGVGNNAIRHLGAWWYGNSTGSNLFGQYLNGKHDNELKSKTMFWNKWLGNSYSYKVMRMMVRPRCPCLYDS